MQQFIWFLGRFHVLALHLPLGILALAATFEILARFRPFKSLNSVLLPLWMAGALSAIATVVLGYMHASEPAFEGLPAVEAHRWAGVWLSVVASVIAVLRARLWSIHEKFWIAPVALVFCMLFVTGHLGGNLTHGDTYLVQYAPAPIRVLAGLPASAGPRPRPTDLASADIYLDVVQPALERRCANCHNDSKRSGGLSIASYDTLMEGGENGPVIMPGNSADSDLFHRVSIAPEDENFMPKEGKTPLTKNEVVAVGWWIEQGAPQTASIGSLKLTADASTALQALIGASADDTGSESTELADGGAALPAVTAADADVIANAVAAGFIVRNIYQGSNLLDVDYAARTPVTPETMAALAALGPNVLRLNLRGAGVTDDDVKIIATLQNLQFLRVEKNDITDAGAEGIAKLSALTSLNLTNTRITDRGLATLAALPQLEHLYLWGADVSSDAVSSARAEHAALQLDVGLKPEDVPTDVPVVPPDA